MQTSIPVMIIADFLCTFLCWEMYVLITESANNADSYTRSFPIAPDCLPCSVGNKTLYTFAFQETGCKSENIKTVSSWCMALSGKAL